MPAGRSPECIGTTVRRSPCQTFRWLPFPGSSRCSMPSLAARRRSRRRSSEARIQGESGTQGDARARKIGQICPTIRPAARRDRPRGRPRGRPLDGPGRPRRPRRRPVGMSPTPGRYRLRLDRARRPPRAGGSRAPESDVPQHRSGVLRRQRAGREKGDPSGRGLGNRDAVERILVYRRQKIEGDSRVRGRV